VDGLARVVNLYPGLQGGRVVEYDEAELEVFEAGFEMD
jgi:hypothetical protein